MGVERLDESALIDLATKLFSVMTPAADISAGHFPRLGLSMRSDELSLKGKTA